MWFLVGAQCILDGMKQSHDQQLMAAFRDQVLLTLGNVREVLGGVSEPTARRALRKIAYRSSYNENGRYYTVYDERRFDRWGLWSWRGVRFSRDGSLTATVRRLVGESATGWTRRELQELLGVSVQTVLTTLRSQGKVERARVGPAFVYVAAGSARRQLERREQLSRSQQQRSEVPLEVVVAVLLVLIRHPKSTPRQAVRFLKGHSPPILLKDIEEVFERYDLAQKGGRSN